MNTQPEQQPRLLEAGDILATKARHGSWYFHTIDRVTPKRAFAGNRQFERELLIRPYDRSPATREIGGDTYTRFQLATPEIIEADRVIRTRWALARKVKYAPFDSLSLETLETVAAILFPEKTEEK